MNGNHDKSLEHALEKRSTHEEPDSFGFPSGQEDELVRALVEANTSALRRGAPAQVSALTEAPRSGRPAMLHACSAQKREIKDDLGQDGIRAAGPSSQGRNCRLRVGNQERGIVAIRTSALPTRVGG